ncbi:hypothetical protein [Streptomyces sp. NPDC057002]|uniref:hypothetical protein n=1 Tax=Streptomyces sp. NPDC057002 TaxID=3345992 RepID=UPI0036438827
MTAPERKAAPPLDLETTRACADRLLAKETEAPSPERVAYLRMLLHCPACRECRAVDDDGEAVGSCVTGDRLYEEYRRARRGPAASSETSPGESGMARTPSAGRAFDLGFTIGRARSAASASSRWA